MSYQNVRAPYMLLKQQMGERKPNKEEEKPLQMYIFGGEILLEIPEKEQIPREDGKPAHNYCRYDDLDVTTYNNGISVSPLYGAELDYLLGIDRHSVRAIEYLQVDKLAWIMDLKCGTEVFFQLNREKDVPLIIPGIIRYYGRIPGHEGVMFGIEIKVITRCVCVIIDDSFFYHRIKNTEVKVQLMDILISSVVIRMLFMCQWRRLL